MIKVVVCIRLNTLSYWNSGLFFSLWCQTFPPPVQETHIADFSFFLIWDCSVPSPPTDDWFKRPGALQRLCMTSEETLALSLSLSGTSACSMCASAVCVCVCAAQTGRQAVLTRTRIVCAQICDTRWESYRTNNVLLGAGTISAQRGRTVTLFLKSLARSSPLFYWQTIQQHWQMSMIFMGIDTVC